jgi:oxygen-independent coproporphyrinogen-3 oxidase
MKSDLAARYGQERLPRYTSYPTAPHFSNAVGCEIYVEWLRSIEPSSSASLYLHVPFCRSMCWYCGCHTSITRRDEPIAAYVAALCREIDLVSEQVDRPIRIDHIHFGGGTPTIMMPELFAGLVDAIRHSFFVPSEAGVAVEIDPRTLTGEMIGALACGGINRASLGVQSFDPIVQRAINRVQSFEETAVAMEGLRRAGVMGINFDLIYGLPHQTVASCLDTVRKSVELRPNRFSVFGYAHVPTFKKHQRKIDDSVLPDSSERHHQSVAIASVLKKAGYVQIGLDHFALPDDPIEVAMRNGSLRRNFQGYTTDAGKVLLGFGASAIGHLEHGYVQNEVGIRTYLERISAGKLATARGFALSDDDRLRAEIIERIMCDFGADLGQVCGRHGVSPDTVLKTAHRLDDLISDGVVDLEGTSLTVPEGSRFLIRSVVAAFDAYLDRSTRVHSSAV